MDLKKCYTAFKKCNEIGKKMSPSSMYILVNGMMISYQDKFDEGDKEEYVAHGINISFIDEKICKDLDALCYIPLLINGTDVYRMNKEYDFDRFEINEDYLYLVYKGIVADESDFTNDFIDFAIDKGFNKEYVWNEIQSNFSNDIDLLEIYIKYKKQYKPKEKYKEFKIECEILKEENDMIKKSNKIIKELLSSNIIAEKDIDDAIYQRVLIMEKPTTLKFRNDNDEEVFKLRVMKSLFRTGSTSSKTSIKICKNKDDDNSYYILLNIINKGFHNVIVYRAINY